MADIVMEIISAVLVAVSIPIFSSQLEKARLATNQANARAAYAAVEAQYLLDDTMTGDFTYDATTDQLSTTATAGTVSMKNEDIFSWTAEDNNLGKITYKVWTLTVADDGQVSGYKARPALN